MISLQRLIFTPIVALMPALMLSGCAAPQAGPAFTILRGERIGFLVETADAPVHTHYQSEGGHAVRQARAYSHSWQLDSAVAGIVHDELTQAGFTAVDLEASGLRHEDLAGLVQPAGRQWEAGAGMADQLRGQGLRAVVLVKDARVMAEHDCNGGPCERIAEGPGVYSSTKDGSTTWRAVAGFDWNIFLLDPPGDLAEAPLLRATLRVPSVELLGTALPADPAILTEPELDRVRTKVLEYVEATAEDAVIALGGRRTLVPASMALPADKSSGQ